MRLKTLVYAICSYNRHVAEDFMDVYLLGAGFSSDAGVPTMINFLGGVGETACFYRNTDVHAVLQRAINYAKRTGSNNIEELLAFAVNDPAFFDLIWSFGLTVNHFSRQFLDQCRTGDNLGWYEDFARLVADSEAHVFTFNYDLILEEVLWWRLGCVEDYLISFAETRHAPGIRQSSCHVPIYKLHGSVSWLWCLDCHNTVNRSRHILPAAYKNTRCYNCGSRLIPLLIPPTYQKAYKLARILEPLWEKADTLFSQSERLIVGGLSLADRDTDVRQRFLRCTASNKQLKEVVLVNRDEDTCRAIGSLLPHHVTWRSVSSFPRYCKEYAKDLP
jgi:NAD-dependent SIR2 family protein deacetylase